METGWPELQQRRRERGLEKMGEKRKEKSGERESCREKKKGQLRFFYSMKSYNNFTFVKSYCSTLAI